VTYDYTPIAESVPEAPSIAVLSVGLLGLGLTKLRRNRSTAISDAE
jgi:hypothetical protein